MSILCKTTKQEAAYCCVVASDSTKDRSDGTCALVTSAMTLPFLTLNLANHKQDEAAAYLPDSEIARDFTEDL